jgi:murein DD-endopeptidase MepM/ murein hydrolase activator NlpD
MAASNAVVMTLIVVALIILCGWFFTNKNALGIYLGDKFIGNISETNMSSEELLKTAVAKLKSEKGINLEPNEEITLKPVHASDKTIVSIDYALSEICNSMTYQVEAFCITVGGKETAVLGNNELVQQVLEQVKAKYVPEDAVVSSYEFVPEVKVESKFVSADEILKPETAFSLLTQTSNEPKTYTVQSGDTLSKIASDNDMKIQEVIDINDDIENENSILKIGQEINLVVPVPVVSVKANVTVTEKVTVAKDYEYVDNNNEYMTYQKVITNGSDGEKEVTYNVTYLNGYADGEKQVVSEKITKEPVTEVVERGTLQEPPKRALGSFKYPTSGRLTSGYGARWGTTHKGIDIASSYGTRIYASDGGVVTQAGYNSGGYGYLVVIDHGNGFQTYYGHNSKIAVSVGQRVAQGELIAYMGSTGNSTGNHCHFEIRKNGVPQNPLNYL